MPTVSPVTRVAPSLAADDRARVLELVAAAERGDHTRPVNDQAWLDIHGEARDGIAHLLAERGDDLVGYAYLDSATSEPTGQLVVTPGARRQGVATAMMGELGFDPHSPEGAERLERGVVLSLWAFGDLPPARAAAAAFAYASTRELLIMERPLADVAEPHLPADVTVRAFTEADIDAWLRVNARAFAHHPEQGTMSEDDLRARMAEPWFDPAGFLIAERDGEVVGFHWTKVHDEQTGEVYVIGVDPDHAGGGLGRQLLAAGLAHLRDRGLQRVILYVEAAQDYVVRLYESAGFTVAHRDVLYAPVPTHSPNTTSQEDS